MERIIFKNSRKLNLVGNLYRSKENSNSIIIFCHGFMSNKYSKGRFKRLAKALNHKGFDVLAFDFSGCGESDDTILTIEKEVDDLNSAISFVSSTAYKNIGLYGHSLGSLICLKSNIKSNTPMVLSGALTGPMNYKWEDIFTSSQLEELSRDGILREYIFEDKREKITIDRRILDSFKNIDQRELLKDIVSPTLIIHGDRGEEEGLLYKNSKNGMKYLSKESKLEIIGGADHSFMEDYDELIGLVVGWFEKYL